MCKLKFTWKAILKGQVASKQKGTQNSRQCSIQIGRQARQADRQGMLAGMQKGRQEGRQGRQECSWTDRQGRQARHTGQAGRQAGRK